ncbi:MAG: multidrug effflux MFS transporter [Alphaproteobacteria bacterium]|nr:multidrug effflux MFS transporter [Alphaproteobacteria bacterium]
MLDKPLFSNLSQKVYDVALLGLVTLMYILLCAEADMYVPAFPQMIQYFGVEENQIQLILSLNFGGLCIAGLLAGPLSDSYGRRSVLLGGLLLFVFSSAGCVYTNDFNLMLIWRLLQGVAASIPMVIGAATFLDKYSAEKAAQLVGVINSVISASMAGAPVVGAWISQVFDWRANFTVIFMLALISFLGTLMFIEETLPSDKRKEFRLGAVLKNYVKLAKSFEFMCYTLIVNFPFTAVVVYIANLSVIFVNHIGMSLEKFSYYQATTMGTFIIFSLVSIKLIGKKGLDYTKNLGGLLAFIGSVGLFYTSQAHLTNVTMICSFMALVAAGGAMMAGTFGMKALSIFPEINGTAMAMMTGVRQLLAAGLVVISEILFDGTIAPVASIIFIYAVACVISYMMLTMRSSFVAESSPS